MTEPLYRLRIANGNEYGPSPAADISASIRAGKIATNSHVAVAPFTQYVPILSVQEFALAFQEIQSRGSIAPAPHVNTPAQTPEPRPEPPQERPKTVEDFLFDNTSSERSKSYHPLASASISQEIEALEQQAQAVVNEASTEEPGDEVAVYLRERSQFDLGLRHLEENRTGEAMELFRKLAEAHPNTSEYHSSYAYSQFKLAKNDQDKLSFLGKLREIHEKSPYCVSTLVYLGRSTVDVGRAKAAIKFYKSALEIEPGRRDIANELQRAEDISSGKITKSASSDSHRLGSDFKSRQKSKSEASSKTSFKVTRKSKKDNVIAEAKLSRLLGSIFSFGVIFVTLYAMAVLSRMGVNEYFYDASDNFFYLRRGLLIIVGIGLSLFFLKDQKFSKTDFVCNPIWLVPAIGLGVGVGLLSPAQAVKSTLEVVIGLTIFHVVAEEIFFRGFLARNLARGLPGHWLPSVFGGLLFGLYHMTYYSFAANPLEAVDFSQIAPAAQGALVDLSPSYEELSVGLTTSLQAWQSIGMITIGAGIPLYLMYYKSRSFLPPLLCHLSINLTMMYLSYGTLKL